MGTLSETLPTGGHVKRIRSLDGLRAISIVAVLVGHFAYTSFGPSWVTHSYAHAGVVCFFVLSGFLITSLLVAEQERTGTIDIKMFYIRRAYRILPVVYLYIAIMMVIHWRAVTTLQAVSASTFLSSYFESRMPFYFSHLWSLSCEEQFYLLWPLAMTTRFRKPLAWSAFVAAPICRYWFVNHDMDLESLFSFPASIDGLAAGSLLALYRPTLARYHHQLVEWKGVPLIWVATAMAPLLTHANAWDHVLPYSHLVSKGAWTVFIVGIAWCIQAAVYRPPSVLNVRPVVWLGTLSYSLYVWQMPFADPASGIGWKRGLGLAFTAAIASFYLVERPILKVRDARMTLRRYSKGGRQAPVA